MKKVSGSFVGIGLTCTKNNGIYIVDVYDGSPAKEAGLVKGDTIIAVDGVAVSDENYDSVINSIAGEAGSSVELTVRKADGGETVLNVIRREIVVASIISEMLDGNVGYIKITQFSQNSDEQFSAALNSLINSGAKSFLFDVRDNSGGSLDSILNILDRLLPEGPIMHIIRKDAKETKYSTADESLDFPMAVLINENTASAAELFCSALRDYDTARLFGVKTYGKGCMQTISSFSDGSGIRLTTAFYNPPFGDNYDGIGVSPHVEVINSDNEDSQLISAINYLNN